MIDPMFVPPLKRVDRNDLPCWPNQPRFVIALLRGLSLWFGQYANYGGLPILMLMFVFERQLDSMLASIGGPVAGLVGIEGGVVSGVINLESSGVEAPDWRPRHDKYYHEA